MYPNFEAERARRGLTLGALCVKLAERGINVSISKLSRQLKGDIDIPFSQAVALKHILGTDMIIEDLFISDDVRLEKVV